MCKTFDRASAKCSSTVLEHCPRSLAVGRGRPPQGSIQGSVLSKSDPVEPDLTPSKHGQPDRIRPPLGGLVTRRSRVGIPPPLCRPSPLRSRHYTHRCACIHRRNGASRQQRVRLYDCRPKGGGGVLSGKGDRWVRPVVRARPDLALERSQVVYQRRLQMRWRGRPQIVLSASAGASRAARIAGSSPATAPISIAAAKPPAHADAGITSAQPLAVA